jgi:soluble cytochrome b562
LYPVRIGDAASGGVVAVTAEVEDMESVKAYLPDILHARVEDLASSQTVDEEITAHMRELESQLDTLQTLARETEAENAAALAEDVRQLCTRIRRDFIEIAYRQGLIDGTRLREVLTGVRASGDDEVPGASE